VHLTLKGFIALSVALHAGAGLLVAARHVPTPAAPPIVDRWGGNGVEIDAVATPNTPAAPPKVPAPEAPVPRPEPPERTSRPPNERPAPSRATSAKATARATAPESAEKAAPASEPARAPAETPSTERAAATFGASGLPAGVRHLPNAFTRALAIANRGDPRWQKLPFGRTGEARVRLVVNEQGELGELAYQDDLERDALAPVVRHLLDNTMLLLRAGRFSLDPRRLTAGVQRLRVVVEVGERADLNSEGDPGELFGVAWEAPQTDKPGKSGFVLNSGRQITAWVWLE
jgi:hypothetical protein